MPVPGAPARHDRRRAGRSPVSGRARLGRRTKELVKRLGPDDVAIIDHADIDRIAAEDLVASGVRAVVNLSPSSTDRYPNPGRWCWCGRASAWWMPPARRCSTSFATGTSSRSPAGRSARGTEVVARGERLVLARLEEAMLGSGRGSTARSPTSRPTPPSTSARRASCWRASSGCPATRTSFQDRHVLIVVRGTTYRSDLRTLRAYIHDVRPVLVGVDGGADALLEEGLEPDVILGDMDSASDAALRSGAEVIVHAYSDGRAPGSERLEAMGVDHLVAPAIGTSQDVAMLLAYENGAELIVSVGAQFNLVEFLDKNRAGMSSTFLTRLRIGDRLVDAKGVSRLYNPGISGRLIWLFLGVAVLLMLIVVLVSDPLSELADRIWLKIEILLGL